MDISVVKEKIKKLLALSEDTKFDAESYSALQKAQELMAKYKLEESDIKEEDKKRVCIRKKTTLHYGSRSSDHYMNELADIIADNFCCVNYLSRPRGSKTYYICFMGFSEDVEIACDVLYAANSAIIRGYNRVYKEASKEYGLDYLPAKIFNPLKVGYIEGYLAGLKNVLDAQKEKNQEWGLVLVAPQEAKKFVGELESFSINHTTYYDNTYYDAGYSDGNKFQLNEKLNSAKINNKLEGN